MKKLNLQRTFLKDEIYDYLKNQIISGDLEENEQLKLSQLENDLGVSRTPIRDALLMLENEGFVVTKANSRTYVAPINHEEIEEIYNLVGALEAYGVIEGIDKISEEDISDLRELNEEFKASLDKSSILDIIESDNAFHHKIIENAANNTLVDLIKQLKCNVERTEIKYFSSDTDKWNSYHMHEKLIDALEEKDTKMAIHYIRRNWNDTLERIMVNYKSKDEELT